jgi:O-acetyl-ADP-ribose deacetylase (regulator of RNase III)
LIIECVRGDIVSQPDVDAVVCAANGELAPGAGVAGVIHRAAGPGLYEECRPLAPIRTGQAVITSGHGLPNQWCIHTLGPVYHKRSVGSRHSRGGAAAVSSYDESPDPAAELASCYREVLARAEEKGLSSVATPAISTGVFGYPIDEAASVAITAVTSVAPTLRNVRLVRFVLWEQADFDVHQRVLERQT